jgi:hypothetical protein
MKSLVGTALVTFGLAACGGGSDAPELLEGFDPPAPGDGEIQVVGPIVHDIAPGADVTLCSYLPVDQAFEETLDIVGATGFQSGVGGHHSVLYMVQAERPLDTHECTDDDMINSRYLAGAGGGDAGGETAFLPEGVAYRAEGGKQLMVQTHWINTQTYAIDGQAAFNLRVQPPSDQVELGNLFTWTSTQIAVDPQSEGSARTDCVVEREMKFYHLGGHAHERGTHVTLTHTPADGTPAVFYDEPWESYYSFDPPRIYLEREEAMVVQPGDTLSIDCTYFNDTDEVLGFPLEMCTGFGFFFPAEAQFDCTDGRWPEGP